MRQTDNAEDSLDNESNSEDKDFPEEAQERPARTQTHPMFGAAAVNAICSRVWGDGSLTFVPAKLATTQGTNNTPDIEHFCAPWSTPRRGRSSRSTPSWQTTRTPSYARPGRTAWANSLATWRKAMRK